MFNLIAPVSQSIHLVKSAYTFTSELQGLTLTERNYFGSYIEVEATYRLAAPLLQEFQAWILRHQNGRPFHFPLVPKTTPNAHGFYKHLPRVRGFNTVSSLNLGSSGTSTLRNDFVSSFPLIESYCPSFPVGVWVGIENHQNGARTCFMSSEPHTYAASTAAVSRRVCYPVRIGVLTATPTDWIPSTTAPQSIPDTLRFNAVNPSIVAILTGDPLKTVREVGTAIQEITLNIQELKSYGI